MSITAQQGVLPPLSPAEVLHILSACLHSPYHRDKVHQELRELSQQFNNVHILMQNSILIEDKNKGSKIRVLGTTLWHHAAMRHAKWLEQTMNDYSLISIDVEEEIEGKQGEKTVQKKRRRITTKETNAWHHEEVQWLKTEVKQAKERQEMVVVLTHHVPTHASKILPSPLSFLSLFPTTLLSMLMGVYFTSVWHRRWLQH